MKDFRKPLKSPLNGRPRYAQSRSSLTPSLGDSGFSVIRRDDSAFHSSPQTHYFNCPLQLSKIPPKLRGQGVIMDKPEMGEKFEVKLGNGDVMILYVSPSRRARRRVGGEVWPPPACNPLRDGCSFSAQ